MLIRECMDQQYHIVADREPSHANIAGTAVRNLLFTMDAAAHSVPGGGSGSKSSRTRQRKEVLGAEKRTVHSGMNGAKMALLALPKQAEAIGLGCIQVTRQNALNRYQMVTMHRRATSRFSTVLWTISGASMKRNLSLSETPPRR